MAFESFGTMKTDQIVKDPTVLNLQGKPVKSEASVLELRFVSHNSDYTAWKDIAVKFYYLLRDLNALPNDTDTVQNTRLT